MKYMISSADRTTNYPIYSTPTDIDSFILSNSDQNENPIELTDKKNLKSWMIILVMKLCGI